MCGTHTALHGVFGGELVRASPPLVTVRHTPEVLAVIVLPMKKVQTKATQLQY